MSTLFFERQLSPFDLLFKDFFKSDLNFQPATEAKIPHPVDVFETKNGLHIEGDILKIAYNKDTETTDAKAQERNYIHKGVAKRSFNLGYKIASKFDLSKAEALMENGLLAILIPFADEAKPKVLKIK